MNYYLSPPTIGLGYLFGDLPDMQYYIKYKVGIFT